MKGDYAEDYTVGELMCVCIAREIEEGDIIVLGSFTPLAYAAYILAKKTHAPHALIVAYAAIDASPFRLSFTTSEAAALKGASASWSMGEIINSIHQTGRADVEAVSGAQIDQHGNVNISVIGDYRRPRVRLPGGAGASEVMKMHRKMIGYVPSHNRRILVERVDFITGTRYLISSAERQRVGLRPGPVRFITNLCVLRLEEKGHPLVVETIHPGVSVREVVDNTGFALQIPEGVPATEPPTRSHVQLLREEIDPLKTLEFDMKSGRERLAYLQEVLRQEWQLVD